MKSLAKVAKSGAELAGSGTRSGPTSRAAFPRCEFSEHSTASVGQGTPRPHTSLILFTNLTSLRESLETRAAAPSSRSATGCSSGRGDSCSAEAGISPDRFLLRLFQSDLLPWPWREAGDGRLQIGRPEETNLRRRGSAHTGAGPRVRVQREAGPTASREMKGVPACALSPQPTTRPPPSASELPTPPLPSTSPKKGLSFLSPCLATAPSRHPYSGTTPWGARLSPVWPQYGAAVETRTRGGACRLWFAGRGLRAQARVQAAQLRSRPPPGLWLRSDRGTTGSLAGETHSWGQRARGRRRSECPHCLSASWVSANEGLFLHPWKDGGVSLPWRACAPPDGGGFACRTRACPECSPANRTISAGTALEASPSRPTALPQRGKRRDVAGSANPLQARSVTLAGKKDV